jgi:hypothetical protein
MSLSYDNAEQGAGAIEGATGAMLSELSALNDKEDKNGTLKEGEDALKNELSELVPACEEFAEYAIKIADIKFYRMVLIGLAKQKWDTHSDLSSELPSRKSKEQMKKDYLEFVQYYYKAESLYNKTRLMAKVVKKEAKKDAELAAATSSDKLAAAKAEATYEAVKEALENIEDAYRKINEDDFLKLIEDVIILHTALENKKYFEVSSPPIQIDADYVAFDVTIEPTQVNDLLPYAQAKSFPFEIGAKGAWKSDFSVGPTMSFLGGAHDAVHYLENSGSDTMVVLKEGQNKNIIRPGLAAMMHFYPRTGKYVALAGMFGVGVDFKSITDPDLSLYLGVSAVLGKGRKIMLSAGASFTRVARIKSQYTVGDSYHVDDIKLEDVTSTVFKPAMFIAVSYNLTNRVIIK